MHIKWPTKTRTKTEIQKKEVDLKNNKKIFLEYNVISTTIGEKLDW